MQSVLALVAAIHVGPMTTTCTRVCGRLMFHVATCTQQSGALLGRSEFGTVVVDGSVYATCGKTYDVNLDRPFVVILSNPQKYATPSLVVRSHR